MKMCQGLFLFIVMKQADITHTYKQSISPIGQHKMNFLLPG